MVFDNIGGKKTKHSIFFFEKRQEKKKDIRFFHVSSQRQNNNIDVPRGKIEHFKGFPRRFAHAQKYQNKDSSRRRYPGYQRSSFQRKYLDLWRPSVEILSRMCQTNSCRKNQR